MKRVFVTGGSGFVGRNLIAALGARQIAVRALARSDTAAAAVRAVGAEPVRGDLSAPDRLRDAMIGCDTVFHAAAKVDEHGTLQQHMEVTVRGTENVLAAARSAGVARFVHVSSEAVLADGKPIIDADETRPLPATAAGPYPITKGLAEQAVVAANGPELATVVIRPRFIWGAGDTSLTPKLVDAVKRGRFAWINGGHYPTSTCHIANVVEGTLLAAERGTPGEIYFLTDGDPVDFRDFLGAVFAAHGVGPVTRSVPRWLASTLANLTSWMKVPPVSRTALALIGHEVTVDDRKARRELGYTSAMTREAGLAAMG